jgi:hypothetical protein
MKKVMNSELLEASMDDVYVPSLWYYDLVAFSADQELPTKSKSNVEKEGEEEKMKKRMYI